MGCLVDRYWHGRKTSRKVDAGNIHTLRSTRTHTHTHLYTYAHTYTHKHTQTRTCSDTCSSPSLACGERTRPPSWHGSPAMTLERGVNTKKFCFFFFCFCFFGLFFCLPGIKPSYHTGGSHSKLERDVGLRFKCLLGMETKYGFQQLYNFDMPPWVFFFFLSCFVSSSPDCSHRRKCGKMCPSPFLHAPKCQQPCTCRQQSGAFMINVKISRAGIHKHTHTHTQYIHAFIMWVNLPHTTWSRPWTGYQMTRSEDF